jgi:hypothetical protein
MSEVIAELPYRVVGADETCYYISVAADQRLDGHWEAWLEYVPDDESDVLLTGTETTQSSRDDLVHWAEALTETYVQGAFARAMAVTEGIPTRLAARRASVEVVEAGREVARADLVDPFELFDEGPVHMRAVLRSLSRSTLLGIIDVYGLNPAKKSLAWLSQPQLVTFIVTAVDVQLASGKRDTGL